MKKLIALFLCLCLAAGIVPALASSAESDDYPVEQMKLVSELLKDILEAAEKANEKEVGINAAGKMNIIGGVFAVLKRVMAVDIASLGVEEPQPTVAQEPGVHVVDQERLEDMILELQELTAMGNTTHGKPGTSSPTSPLNRSNSLMTAVYETMQESSQLKNALEHSGSRLTEVLADISNKFRDTLTAGGPDNLEFTDEAYAAYEEELKKVSDDLDYSNDAKKGKIIGLLNLLHSMMEDLKTGMDKYRSGEIIVGEINHTIATFLLNDIVEAALFVSKADIETRSPGKMDIAGGVFEVADRVLEEIDSTRTLASKEEMEALTAQLGDLISGGRPADAEEPSDEGAIQKVSAILDYTIQTVDENQVISEASEATGVNLSDALMNVLEIFKDYFAGTNLYTEADQEAAFAAYEADAAKVSEYIQNHSQHEKAKALGLLNLIGEMIGDIHNTF